VNVVEFMRLAQPPSIMAVVKRALYHLVGLNAKAEWLLDVHLSRRVYRKAFGREPNLEHPVLFSEKVVARKLFDRRPVFPMLADKLLAREFAADRIGNQFLPELYFVCDRFEEIDFERLPDKFVIKTNHGSGWSLIVEDKRAFDRVAAMKILRHWMKTSYYFQSRESFYKNIDRKILVEEYLQESSGAPAIDYKFYVYDGVPKFVQIRGGLMNNHYDRHYQKLPIKLLGPGNPLTLAENFRQNYARRNPSAEFAFPPSMEQLFDIAGRLGRGLDFIRVDLYNPGGRILFGEMTSLPGGGARSIDPPIYDRILGQDWHLTLCDPPLSSNRLPERQRGRPSQPGSGRL
jgi:hypothetical protein